MRAERRNGGTAVGLYTGVSLPVDAAVFPVSPFRRAVAPPYRLTAVPPFRPLAVLGAGVTAGFTLIEVLVSLALAGMVLVLAHQIFAACIIGADAIAEARDALDREQNAGRLLGPIILSIDVGGGGGSGFDGRSDAASFDSWVQTPDGWLERERVTLELRSAKLVITRSRSGAVVLADSLADLRLDYLLSYGEEAAWVTGWASPVSPPLAIRLRRSWLMGTEARSDTTLFPIKPRG